MMQTRTRPRCRKCGDWVTESNRAHPQRQNGRGFATEDHSLCVQCYATAEGLCHQWHKLPHFVAQKYSHIGPKHPQYEELLSDLHRVFWSCCVKFDAGLGWKFTTYAANSMRQAIKTYFRWRSRQGFHGNSEGSKIVASLDADRGDLDIDVTIANQIEDDGRTTDEILHQQEQREWIEKVLSRIDKRYALVLRARHLGPATCTLDAVAQQLGVTRERVRQIELKAAAEFQQVVEQMGGERVLEAVL